MWDPQRSFHSARGAGQAVCAMCVQYTGLFVKGRSGAPNEAASRPPSAAPLLSLVRQLKHPGTIGQACSTVSILSLGHQCDPSSTRPEGDPSSTRPGILSHFFSRKWLIGFCSDVGRQVDPGPEHKQTKDKKVGALNRLGHSNC